MKLSFILGLMVVLCACPPPAPVVDAGPPPGASVHVVKGGDGTGTVFSDPEGIDCDTACASQDLVFDSSATSVTLTADPARDALFESWDCSGTKSGEPVQSLHVSTLDVKLFDDADPGTLDITCTASFRQLWTLQVVFSGTGTGHVTGSAAATGGGTRIDCPDKCVAGYFDGDSDTLTAVPDTGSVFSTWKLDCTGVDPFTVTLNEDKNCEAHFCPDTDPSCF